ncbi:hypothetical protein EB796_001490 [Bugula neritina]|uniref:Uncharacterized protein n=1 Tax=Bugula neritina TaxID=10212 RepID=A0A7J7KPU0_BUGNE|nr:hypothetical protein EB796_001490 [Bugula neritina]
MARCDEKKCTLPSNCAESEAVYRPVNGTTCRDCDRCTLFNQRGAADGGNDAVLHQACPDLSRCRQVLLCDEMPSNKTIRIVTNEICKGCAVCRTRQPYCPVIRCPGFWCKKTAMFPTSVNVCSNSPIRKQADGGSDSMTPQEQNVAGPDMRNARDDKTTLAMFSSMTSISTPTTTTTTDISTTAPTPNCDAVVPGWQCPTLSCVLVNIDLLTVDGLECYGCPRCANDLGKKPACPTILCDFVNCGDSEDIASGRKYRETGFYNVSGVMCEGCDKCIDCPPIKCEPLHPECLRYTRRTDRRGCVLCPYCEVWRNNQRPSPTGSSGFIQSISTAKCIQSNGNLTNTEPGLITNICEFDKLLPGSQVWTFTNSGLLQKHNTYPQFFRIKHGRTTKCLDILQNSAQAIGLSTCEPFERKNEAWSRQWWKYEEHAQSNVAMTTQ